MLGFGILVLHFLPKAVGGKRKQGTDGDEKDSSVGFFEKEIPKKEMSSLRHESVDQNSSQKLHQTNSNSEEIELWDITVSGYGPSDYEISKPYPENIALFAQHALERPGFKIRIEGHTDFKGTVQQNHTLSLKRALDLKKILIDLQPNLTGRIECVPMGNSKPLSLNKNADHSNRRVTASLVVDTKILR